MDEINKQINQNKKLLGNFHALRHKKIKLDGRKKLINYRHRQLTTDICMLCVYWGSHFMDSLINEGDEIV